MSDNIEAESEIPAKMAEIESSEAAPKKPTTTAGFNFSIWPPAQKTRDAVIRRLVEELSGPSILSKRYGTIPPEEASEAAKRIEEEAFSSTSASASAEDDGIETLQIYSKEISRRMLEAVKSRSAASTAGSDSKPEEIAAGEKISDAQTEA